MNDFETRLLAAIRQAVKDAKADGVTGMTVDCLKQCVRPPHGGPRGTNAAWVYDQMFRDLCGREVALRAFTR